MIRLQNGAKLRGIEVSQEPVVVPEGQLHKNKNHLDLEGITPKGIPVIQDVPDDVKTLKDIKAAGGSLRQSAEIEAEEIIFPKELTMYVEDAMVKYQQVEDQDLLLEVGKRIVKELIKNTEDNTGLIDRLK